MNKLLLLIFTFFFYSCASVDTQEDMSAYDYEDEEEGEFLSSNNEEESYDEEMEALSEEGFVTAQSEEKEAEDELKEIEDEFAEFADEEVEYAESTEEALTEGESQEEVTTEIAEEPQDEEVQGEVITETTEELPGEMVSESESDIAGDNLETADQVELGLEATPAGETVSDVNEVLEGEVSGEQIAEESISETPAGEPEQIVQQSVQDSDSSNVRITNIRYENEQVYIDVAGGIPSYRSRFNEATRQFIIEVPNAILMDNLRWPYIMKEFQSGFALLQADQKSENVVRIIIQMRPESPAPLIAETDAGGFIISTSSDLVEDTASFVADVDSEQAEGQILDGEDALSEETFSEEGSIPEDGEALFLQAATIYDFLLNEQKFYGKPITLDVRDANLKDILYFLAEDSGINMIISDQIKDAKVNIQLKEVPWDQALFLIMKQNDLAYIREGNVVTIASIKDFEARQSKLNAIKLQREASAPLKLEIIPIAYAQASKILSQINIFKTTRGNVQADSQNNSLIIRDTEEAISRMKKLIEDLDRTPKQVMISAKIVEASEDFSRSFGISWFVPGESVSPSIGPLSNIEITPAPLLHALPGAPDTGTLGSNLLIGTFKGLGDLDVRLGFAETNGSARVLSSPRIMALNGEAASVNQNSESIAFSAVIPEGGGGSQTQIQRSPLQLSLQVTPEITNVDSIYMQVNVNRSSEGQRETDDSGSSARPVSSRSARTRILVKSGQTAVIGGIYETRETESLRGIPFLQNIPVISWLFSQSNRDKFRTELLLFLTPRIIDIGKGSADVAANTSSK